MGQHRAGYDPAVIEHQTDVNLTIDVADPYGPEVTLGDLTFDGQWVEFYGLLALSRTDPDRRDEFLGVEQLHTMALWSGNKRLASAGKEVARHCHRLQHSGIDAIESKLKTKYWRLRLNPDVVTFRPSREVVHRWIAARARKPQLDDIWIEQLDHLISAQIALWSGEGAQACDALRGQTSFASPDLDAWAGLIDARGTDIYIDVLDNAEALDGLAEHWARQTDAVGRSVAIRIIARVALRKRFSEPAEQYALLNKCATELEHRGDIAALASVINVLGILATRLGRPAESVHHHLRAAAMFGIVGDFASLEATIFNLANARVMTRQLEGELPDSQSLRLLSMSRGICDAFAVGHDTVQSQISGAHWAMDMGDYEAAREYIEAGSAVVAHLDSTFEQGCFLFARARLELLEPSGRYNALRDLRTARREFVSVGAQRTIADIDAMIARARAM